MFEYSSTNELFTREGKLRKRIDRHVISDIRRENIEYLEWVASLPVGHEFEFGGSSHYLTQEDKDRALWAIDRLQGV